MKKLILLFFLICLYSFLNSQELTIKQKKITNEFKNYSYLIIQYPNRTTNKTEGGLATGFLVKYKNKLFLISNYHVITGAEGWQRIIKDFDSLRIRYYDTKNNPKYFTINLSSVNSKRQLLLFPENPDIYVLEISLPKEAKVFSIEHLVFQKQKNADKKIAFSYQFSLFPGNIIESQINEFKLQRELNQNLILSYPYTPDVLGQKINFNPIQNLISKSDMISISDEQSKWLTDSLWHPQLQNGFPYFNDTLNSVGFFNRSYTSPFLISKSGTITISNDQSKWVNDSILSFPIRNSPFYSNDTLNSVGFFNKTYTSPFLISKSNLFSISDDQPKWNVDDSLLSKQLKNNIPNFNDTSNSIGLFNRPYISSPLISKSNVISVIGDKSNGNTDDSLFSKYLENGFPYFNDTLNSVGFFNRLHTSPLLSSNPGVLTISDNQLKWITNDSVSSMHLQNSLPFANDTLNSFDLLNKINAYPFLFSKSGIISISDDQSKIFVDSFHTINLTNNSYFNNHKSLLLGGEILNKDYTLDNDSFKLNQLDNLNISRELPRIHQESYLIDWINFDKFFCAFYEGIIADISSYKNSSKLDSFYFALRPATYHGSSGSPVFLYCEKIKNNRKRDWIEFGGIQCAINEQDNISIILKPEQLIAKLKEQD